MIIEVKDGVFAYPGRENTLNGVSFSLGAGEIMAILGPNGVGKTTLLKCILGFLRWNSGKTLIDGKDTAEFSARELWRKVSYVPQIRYAPSKMTVGNVILLGLAGEIGMFRSPGAEDEKRVRETAKRLGIYHLLGKPCNEISGGELQMAYLGKAIVSRPELLILDEPEANLDFKNRLTVLETVRSLASSGISCIFNTHYPDNALTYSDKALLLSPSASVFGETSDVLTEENMTAAFGVSIALTEAEVNGVIYRSIVPIERR